ncbi:hypothetical protein F750_5281 [Streptomyces sp. PAMC 26508]|nr:hypothetical protein F750_5281 [Streptomyces sp. PAMC 26508]
MRGSGAAGPGVPRGSGGRGLSTESPWLPGTHFMRYVRTSRETRMSSGAIRRLPRFVDAGRRERGSRSTQARRGALDTKIEHPFSWNSGRVCRARPRSCPQAGRTSRPIVSGRG